ncbi:hypothetical protein PA10_00229 [Pseudomonas phage pPa_SNUABM_DT01]|nr:hypothetical protein PA10_00229 [Pseudomonas phage pPa_SNUABM_DT01]
MKKENIPNPRTFLGHPIVFVDSYEQVGRIVATQGHIGEFFVIGDNVKKPGAAVEAIFKDHFVKQFRIRSSGSWNSLFRAMADVDTAREDGTHYSEARDLMFVSLHSPHDISSALNRHRALNNITCREMYWLDTIHLGEEADDLVDMALKTMPSVITPVRYSDLTIAQRFDLTAFEFARFMRPIHCVDSVDNSYKGAPFYPDLVISGQFKLPNRITPD